ncbi:MAG: MoxR family ATPase [Candidatus Woesearchaeota archaeon]
MIDQNSFYIAHTSYGGLDEIQRTLMAYHNKQPIVCEGEAGVGKNQCIEALAQGLDKPIYRVRCTEEMMARDIIGGQKLGTEKKGKSIATKTVFSEGKMMTAMEKNALLVLDEVNQLLPTVQKSLNSALEEYKTIGSLEGGTDKKAGDGFGVFLTYNPGTGVAHADLEPAVRDRCKVFYYHTPSVELQTAIALLKTDYFGYEDFTGMQVRGLIPPNGKPRFFRFNDGWEDFFTGEPYDGTVKPYLFYEGDGIDIDDEKQDIYAVTRSIVTAVNYISAMRDRGTAAIKDVTDYELISVNRMNVNPGSPRLVSKLANDYLCMRELNMDPFMIGDVLISSIIDACIPPAERETKIARNHDMTEVITDVCLESGIYTTGYVSKVRRMVASEARKGLYEALQENDVPENIAEKLLGEVFRYHKKEDNFEDSNEDDDYDIPF